MGCWLSLPPSQVGEGLNPQLPLQASCPGNRPAAEAPWASAKFRGCPGLGAARFYHILKHD